jgi:pimeloyl-ACP methyl ester carboxylesterase
MLPPAELARLRKRCTRGQPQIDELFRYARSFADDTEDVNFTPADLARITADTLIVFGDRDPLYPVDLATELYAAIPHAWLWIVPNGGHGPVFRDQALRFVDTALAFLRGDWKQ